MKLISLNLWGGKIHDPLFKFLNEYNDKIDIFTFQETYKSDRSVKNPNETWSNILSEVSSILANYNYLFSPTFHGTDFSTKVDYPLSHGPAIFWKKSLKPKQKGEVFVHRKENDMGWFEKGQKPDPPKNFQYIVFENFQVLNVHGIWEPAPKYDTPQRFKQSQMIIEFAKKQELPTIIAGDFNLAIYTQSLQMFEDSGYRNLVKESKVTTTRTKLYDPMYRAYDKFADYVLVSKDVGVYEFRVMTDEVSDHLPLYLKFNV